MARKPRIANAAKDTGATKGTTRRIADHAQPRGERKPQSKAATRQGGSPKGHGAPDTPHPSQRGGIKADAKGEQRRGNAPREKRSGEKAPGAGLAKGPSRSRAGSTAAVGVRTRTGRDRGGPNARGRAKDGSRTKGRG
jgi:hypothetical protein